MHALCLLLAVAVPGTEARDTREAADRYTAAILAVNEAHAQGPGGRREDDLAATLPADARAALQELLEAPDEPEVYEALARCAEAALDLDLEEDFERARARLEGSSPRTAERVGVAVSRPRFLLLGRDGVGEGYLAPFADVLDGVLDAYDRVFGFQELSKVPGKKLRVRVHLVERITRPPHFAPQFPFHSEIDFPVLREERLTSPTARGQFQFYGLCHELGHVVAMMDRGDRVEDRHQWAHYTGVVIVEEIALLRPAPPWTADLRDARWRSLSSDLGEIALTWFEMSVLLQQDDSQAAFADAAVLVESLTLEDLAQLESVRPQIERLRAVVAGLRSQVLAQVVEPVEASSPGLPDAPYSSLCGSARAGTGLAYGALLAAIVTEAAREGASRGCDQVAVAAGFGGNAALVCLILDVLWAGAKGFREGIVFCDSDIDGAEIKGVYDRVAHLHGDMETSFSGINELITKVDTLDDKVDTLDTKVDALADHVSVIDGKIDALALAVDELRTMNCELIRLMHVPQGQRTSGVKACSDQPGYPYAFPE